MVQGLDTFALLQQQIDLWYNEHGYIQHVEAILESVARGLENT